MPIDEKEYNGSLIDQLDLLEVLELAAQEEDAKKTALLTSGHIRKAASSPYSPCHFF